MGLPRPSSPSLIRALAERKAEPQNCPGGTSQQGLTSEPRMGLGPCSLSLGELHPDAGVLLLLGEESEGGEREAVRDQAVAGSQEGGLCFLLSSGKARKEEATASLQGLRTLFD